MPTAAHHLLHFARHSSHIERHQAAHASMEDMMDTAEGLIAACAQGVARTCERELEWLVTRQSQTAPDARDSLPSPPLPQLISALAAGGRGGAAGYARVTYSDAIKALSQVREQLPVAVLICILLYMLLA